MKILDEVLENDRGDGFDHSHIPVNASHANTDFFLSLLAFTLDRTPTLDQSFTLVSNTISLRST